MPRAMQITRLPMLVPNPYSKIRARSFALAQKRVCYVGEPIAIVVAESRHIAEDAAAAVAVDYEPLALRTTAAMR
jgi:carbon-monoxide dehydrogenase large subunit